MFGLVCIKSLSRVQSNLCKVATQKQTKTKILMTNGSLMKVESSGAFCNTFDLHKEIIGLENQFLLLLRVAVTVHVIW